MTLPHLRHVIFPYLNIGGYGSCPGSHPYAYYNGLCCCASGFEKNYPPQGAKCDRSRIQIDSLCCRDDIHARCPFGKCSNAGKIF